MPIFVRPRNGGKSFELRVTHRMLPKPVYRSFDEEAAARRAGELAEAALNREEVPSWLKRKDESALTTVAQGLAAADRGRHPAWEGVITEVTIVGCNVELPASQCSGLTGS